MEISEKEAIIRELERISTLMDTSIGIPGTTFRFGVDSLIGLLPGGGDLVGVAISLYIVMRAAQLNVPRRTLARMVGNVAIDGLVGTVPIAGDIFDAVYKANKRNVALALEAIELEPKDGSLEKEV